jgi:hypothetical protein
VAPLNNRLPNRFNEVELRHWSLLDAFSQQLDAAAASSPALAAPDQRSRPGGPTRLLTQNDYLKAFLFAQFNPVIDSMRGLCAASHLPKVQAQVCSRPISLGSFSAAQHVFSPALLERVFANLLKRDPDVFNAPGSRHARLLAIDSTVIRAIPRMDWAEWRYQGKTQRAVRLHLKFHLLSDEPAEAVISEGRICEREAFEAMLKPGELYVGDRNYSRSYTLLARMDELGCGYVIRLSANAYMEVIEELSLSEADRQAGVTADRLVRIGGRNATQHGPVRLITIERDTLEEPLYILTNRLDSSDYAAELVGEIYRSRWQIEMFFRWFKCVLGRPEQWHWLAESEAGVAIQIYSALIAAILLARHIGKLPNKRQMELLRFHQMGMVSDEDMDTALAASLAPKVKKKKQG